MSKKVAVVGSGSWGTALAVMLGKNGHRVCLWSWFEEEAKNLAKNRENKEFLPGVKIPDNVECLWDLEKCINGAEIIISAVPSHAVRNMAKKMKAYVKKDQIIVNVAKGLEDDTLLRLSEVIEDEIQGVKVAVLSGPSHAEEVGKELPTTCVVAAKEREVAEKIQDVFMNPTFRVYTNPDIVGVELGGALKNIIALCAGVIDGLGFGDNTKAALMTRGIAEIARLGLAMGARIETFAGLSGIGDLIVTCTSQHSRNRKAGILIGQGKSVEETLKEVHMVVEGVHTSKAAYDIAKKYEVDMPIVNEAYEVLFNNKNPKEAVVDLMMRNKKHEIEEIVMENYEW